ncbi:DNA polymerase III subunit epsilon [Azospirillum sp. RWY-5-1]|uniref:DNA polymerase III subunit epsilon n=1 Tax=Azospirillum oleiclasticum TaxID=2735135 RepID=A0ABX2T5Z6_9PROT|nr:DNA polymerase III subunit epsilon [Azospirillum oleiclasticum]NYZ11551.1 DNA polymerase III subunit epsilon [Azospirillum oleiclasticum]NYZ18712.1 DNA polymerase III subunit epsilon [Azospirillum oleiclasticum]
MAGGMWIGVMLGLAGAGAALAWLGLEAARLVGDDPLAYALDMGALAVGVIALWVVFARLSRHVRDLGRLRDAIGTIRHRNERLEEWEQGRTDELGAIGRAVADLLRRERRSGGAGGGNLAAVAALLAEPVLVLAETGRIATINGPAARILGTGAEPGRNVYDLLHRPELFRAIERARESGEAVVATLRRGDGAEVTARVADLGLHNGALVLFQTGTVDARALAGPAGRGVQAHTGDDEPLVTLPMTALWVATASTAAGGERVVSVGTVRLSGLRVFPTVSLELSIDPGEPVLAEGSAAVAPGARGFAGAWPVIQQALRGTVVVAVAATDTVAALAREAELAGLEAWEPPPALDVGRLAAAVDPALAGLGADALADALGIPEDRRHGAFAPAYRLAELASTVIGRLVEQGVDTHAAARAAEGD